MNVGTEANLEILNQRKTEGIDYRCHSNWQDGYRGDVKTGEIIPMVKARVMNGSHRQ